MAMSFLEPRNAPLNGLFIDANAQDEAALLSDSGSTSAATTTAHLRRLPSLLLRRHHSIGGYIPHQLRELPVPAFKEAETDPCSDSEDFGVWPSEAGKSCCTEAIESPKCTRSSKGRALSRRHSIGSCPAGLGGGRLQEYRRDDLKTCKQATTSAVSTMATNDNSTMEDSTYCFTLASNANSTMADSAYCATLAYPVHESQVHDTLTDSAYEDQVQDQVVMAIADEAQDLAEGAHDAWHQRSSQMSETPVKPQRFPVLLARTQNVSQSAESDFARDAYARRLAESARAAVMARKQTIQSRDCNSSGLSNSIEDARNLPRCLGRPFPQRIVCDAKPFCDDDTSSMSPGEEATKPGLPRLLGNVSQWQPNRIVGESIWACQACTFHNELAAIVCSMCETPRPAPANKAEHSCGKTWSGIDGANDMASSARDAYMSMLERRARRQAILSEEAVMVTN